MSISGPFCPTCQPTHCVKALQETKHCPEPGRIAFHPSIAELQGEYMWGSITNTTVTTTPVYRLLFQNNLGRYQKDDKTSLDLNEARDDEVLGCSSISWTIMCKQSAHRSKQITTPAPHHSIFTGQVLFLTPNQQCQSTEGCVNGCRIMRRSHFCAGEVVERVHQESTGAARSCWIHRLRNLITHVRCRQSLTTEQYSLHCTLTATCSLSPFETFHHFTPLYTDCHMFPFLFEIFRCYLEHSRMQCSS